MTRSGIFALVALALVPPAYAHPGAAPWDASGMPGRDTCASCHFEAEPVRGAEALKLTGLPMRLEAGKLYDVTVSLKHSNMKVAGFLASATGGAFLAGDGVETHGAQARSTLERARQGETAAWSFAWRAPEILPDDVVFYLSANAGNDDQSPFGDIVYLDKIRAGK